MNSFDLSRNFWNWAFDYPELISTNHAAIYFFAVEHCNRLGGKEKFGFPSQMTMEAIGIKKHQTYIKYFNDLVDYGFFKLIQKSKNQYSANIISLISAMPKKGKALDKAFIKHGAKQIESRGQSTRQSKVPVDKQEIKKQFKQETKKQVELIFPFNSQIFKQQWQYWKNYKNKELNFKYKTIESEQAALKKLAKLSNNNEQIAIEIIHESFANGWKGFFKLKQNGKQGDTAKRDQYFREHDPNYKNY